MGDATVVWLDDAQARLADDETLTSTLVEVLTDARWREAGTGAGPWVCVGTFHSTEHAFFQVSDEGAVEVPSRPTDNGVGWVPQLSTGDMHRLTVQARRQPATAARAVAQTGNYEDAVYGPNVVAGLSAGSVWWFYQDAVSGLAESADGLADGIRELVDTHVNQSIPVARHGNALNKAGSFLAGGNVGLFWSRNRVCHLDGLTDDERDWFTANT